MTCKKDMASEVIWHKFKVDMYKAALEIAKDNEVEETTLMILKKELDIFQDKCNEKKEQFLSNFNEAKSVEYLEEGWYGVRCITTTGVLVLDLYQFKEDEAALLDCEPSSGRHLTQKNIDNIAPALIDEVNRSMYERKVLDSAYLTLSQLGEDLHPEIEENTSIGPSTHACTRWVQRKIGVRDELKAEKYARSNLEEVQEEIMEHFKGSREVWNDKAGIAYRISEDNVVFIVGNNTIITLYEKDFGFTPAVNRIIIFAQLQSIEDAWEELQKVEEECYNHTAALDDEISQYNQQIRTLESQITELKALKSVSSKRKNVITKKYDTASQQFNEQFSKLFRGHKPN